MISENSLLKFKFAHVWVIWFCSWKTATIFDTTVKEQVESTFTCINFVFATVDWHLPIRSNASKEERVLACLKKNVQIAKLECWNTRTMLDTIDGVILVTNEIGRMKITAALCVFGFQRLTTFKTTDPVICCPTSSLEMKSSLISCSSTTVTLDWWE